MLVSASVTSLLVSYVEGVTQSSQYECRPTVNKYAWEGDAELSVRFTGLKKANRQMRHEISAKRTLR